MAKRNRSVFSSLVEETKPRIVALLTAKGKMKPIVIRAELGLDESLCRITLNRMWDEGLVESTGRFYQIASQRKPCAAPTPVHTPVFKAEPESTKTDKAIALVRVENGSLVTDSLIVAEVFGKRHCDVLRAIDNLDCSQEFTERNFAFSETRDLSGKSNTYVRLTRDGFIFLAMGFTGAEAARWKEAFITAFNTMESALLKSTGSIESILSRLTDVQSTISLAMQNCFGLMNNQIGIVDSKIEIVDNKVDRLNYRVTEVESIAGRILTSKRKKISLLVKCIIHNGVKAMGGYCPCCGVEKIVDENGYSVNSEFDHNYSNSLADVEHVWEICKPCHKELTTGKVARKDREAEFKAFQSKLKRIKPQVAIEFC